MPVQNPRKSSRKLAELKVKGSRKDLQFFLNPLKVLEDELSSKPLLERRGVDTTHNDRHLREENLPTQYHNEEGYISSGFGRTDPI